MTVRDTPISPAVEGLLILPAATRQARHYNNSRFTETKSQKLRTWKKHTEFFKESMSEANSADPTSQWGPSHPQQTPEQGDVGVLCSRGTASARVAGGHGAGRRGSENCEAKSLGRAATRTATSPRVTTGLVRTNGARQDIYTRRPWDGQQLGPSRDTDN